jgi:hypothetical protein
MAFDGSSEIAVVDGDAYSIFTVVEDSAGNLGVGKTIQLYEKEFFLDDSTVPTSEILLDITGNTPEYTTSLYQSYQVLQRSPIGITKIKYPINVQESFTVNMWNLWSGINHILIQFDNDGQESTKYFSEKYIMYKPHGSGTHIIVSNYINDSLSYVVNDNATSKYGERSSSTILFHLGIVYDKQTNKLTFYPNNNIKEYTLPVDYILPANKVAYLIFDHNMTDDVRIYNGQAKSRAELRYINYTRGYPVIPEFIQTIAPAKPATRPVVTGQTHSIVTVVTGLQYFTNRTEYTISSFSSVLDGGYLFKFENEVNFSASATITFYEPTLLYLVSSTNLEYSHPENFTDDFTEFWHYDKEAPKLIGNDFLGESYYNSGSAKVYNREFPIGTSQLRINGTKTVLYTVGPPQ